MSIARVQATTKDAGSVTSTTLAFASNVTAGSALFAMGRAGAGTVTVTCSDNVNAGNYAADNTYNDNTNAMTSFIHSMLNAASGATTVTCTLGSSQTLRLIISEFSGIATSSALDQHSTGDGNSTSVASGNVTTTQAAELLLACTVLGGGNSALTSTNGFTTDQDVGPHKAISSYQIVSSISTYAATGTLSVADTWSIAFATYKGTSVINTTITPRIA